MKLGPSLMGKVWEKEDRLPPVVSVELVSKGSEAGPLVAPLSGIMDLGGKVGLQE